MECTVTSIDFCPNFIKNESVQKIWFNGIISI